MMATNSLFGEAIRKRPSQRDDAVLDAAVQILLRRIPHEYLEGSDEDEVLAQLREALKGSDTDGYQLANRLECHGWIPGRDLVEALDGGGLRQAEDVAIREWVQAEGIQPSLPIGSFVSVTSMGKTGKGEIADIDTKRATYTICVPAWGHVRSGLGTHGIILPFEAVEG